jgi:hypothetical protein
MLLAMLIIYGYILSNKPLYESAIDCFTGQRDLIPYLVQEPIFFQI